MERLSNTTLAAGFVLAALTVGIASGLTPLPANPRGSSGAQAPAKNRHVVVISLDGFAAYALADPNLPLPHLRALARAGVMAEAMVGVNPTVTWPNHTSMVTGVGPDRHGVLFNGLPVRNRTGSGAPVKVEAHVDKAQLVLAPTVYDMAHAAGLTTSEVDWVAIEHAPTITWSFSEYGEPQAPVAREMLAAGVITEDELRRFQDAPQPFDDEIWTRAAEHIITAHKPNLLLVHFLATDDIQHKYGARTEAAGAALVLADARVGRLVNACRTAGILPDATFVIVSDHGFRTFTHRIRPNVLLRQRGLGTAAWVMAEGGTAIVYPTGDVGNTSNNIDAVKQAFAGVEGIAEVLTPAEFATYGYPSPAQSDRMGALMLAAREGYVFESGTDGEVVSAVPAAGTHGFLNTDPDMRAIFIASGAGVRRGATLGVIKNVDVAPTIARWLGLEMTNITGRPLDITTSDSTR